VTRTVGVTAVLLARVAPKAPDAVVAIALALDTDNPEAHESVVDAALALDITVL